MPAVQSASVCAPRACGGRGLTSEASGRNGAVAHTRRRNGAVEPLLSIHIGAMVPFCITIPLSAGCRGSGAQQVGSREGRMSGLATKPCT